MIPNGMTSGGLPGVVRMVTHFFPALSYSVVYYAISMVILIVAFFTMGKAEVARIIALASALIGIGYGLATGIGYIGGFSSGGTDTIARILKYKVFNYLRVGDIQMVIDITIILISALVFNVNIALYAALTAFIAARVIAMVMVGQSGKFVQFDIITSKKDFSEEIAEYIMKDVNRAVTSHVSRGEYSHEERRTLTVICTPAESVKIKKFVAEADPDAFATIMPITSVWGKRFADISKVDNT